MVSLGFLLAYSFQPLTEMNIRNISWGVKGSRSLRLTTLPPSCADLLEIYKPQPLGTLCVTGMYRVCFICVLLLSRWSRGLRCSSAASSFLGLRVRIPPESRMSFGECCVLSGRGPCDGLITRPEECWRVWGVRVCSWGLNSEEALAK
jgi:hypothetical protein